MKINSIHTLGIVPVSLLLTLTITIISCNKDLPDATPIIYPPVNSSTTSIGALVNTDSTYSFFKAAADKAGLLTQLSDETKIFTVFLPDNAAFRASGIPTLDALNTLPVTSLAAIAGYAIIPGRQFLSDSVSSTFPNVQLPSTVTIAVLPGTTLPLKLSTFPSKRGNGFWDNNIPVVTPDIKMQNGVVHIVAGIVAPPGQVLRDAIYSNPNLTFFKAAVARADSGQTGLNKIDSLLGYAVTNMTLLIPTDTAFQSLLFKNIYGALLVKGYPQQTAYTMAVTLSASPDVFSNPALFDVLTATTVRAILVYHFLASDIGSGFQPNIRAFSVNFSSTPTYYPTLINTVVAIHPGIKAHATFTGPFVSNLQFTGYGTFPPNDIPYSGVPARAISMDHHAVNGIYHIIEQVLLPQ